MEPSTSKNTGSGLEFRGRQVYPPSAGQDIRDPEHQSRIETWMRDYEKNRVFVFPTQNVRVYATLILVAGLLSLIIQIASASVRFAFVPSLLGSGIWVAMFCIATGAFGIASVWKLKTAVLMDFNIMALIATGLSAIIIVLNSIGLEMYTKMCYHSMVPTRDNLISDQNATVPVNEVAPNASLNWVGNCDESSFILMSIVVFLHVFLFITTASCSSSICRSLNSSYRVGAPAVFFHSDTVEIEKSGPAGIPQPSTAGLAAEKMMEQLHHPEHTAAAAVVTEKHHHSGLERGHEHHGGGFNTPAVP